MLDSMHGGLRRCWYLSATHVLISGASLGTLLLSRERAPEHVHPDTCTQIRSCVTVM